MPKIVLEQNISERIVLEQNISLEIKFFIAL